MTKTRKPPEPAPPSMWIKSKSGTYARLVRTTQRRGDRWLYRLEYREVRGTNLWTLDEITLWAAKWLTRAPKNWRKP